MILQLVILYKLQLDPIKYGWVGLIINLCNFIVFPFTFLILGCIAFRRKNSGYLSVSQCLKTGLIITLVGAIIYSLFYTIFVNAVPEYIDNIIAQTRIVKLHNEPKIKADGLAKFLDDFRKGMQPSITVPMVMIVYTLIGMIGSFIVGSFLRREKPATA
jgi:aminopeptidase-like protein